MVDVIQSGRNLVASKTLSTKIALTKSKLEDFHSEEVVSKSATSKKWMKAWRVDGRNGVIV